MFQLGTVNRVFNFHVDLHIVTRYCPLIQNVSFPFTPNYLTDV